MMRQAAPNARPAYTGPRPPDGGAGAIFFPKPAREVSVPACRDGDQPTRTSTCVPSTFAS
jgi:hypothetical protein